MGFLLKHTYVRKSFAWGVSGIIWSGGTALSFELLDVEELGSLVAGVVPLIGLPVDEDDALFTE